VEEVGSQIEVGAVATPLRGLDPGFDRSSGSPPLSSGLAGSRNHPIDKNQHAHANPRTHERGRKTSERLGNEHRVARTDCFDDSIGVYRETGLFVVAGQVNCNRFVPRLFKESHETMPVPRNATGTGNENESDHNYRRRKRSDAITIAP
jgi:hypothetical protein